MIRVGVTVMAHPRRAAFVAELLTRLDRPATVVWDRHDDRWETGRRALLTHDPDASHHLVIQDDAIACRDLVAGVEQALAHVPENTPLCLYCGRTAPYRRVVQTLVDRAGDASWLVMPGLHWGVGVVLPVGLIPPMVEWADGRDDIANYDKRISRWLGRHDIPVWYPWPSLVDHRDSPSLVPGRGSAGRRAHRFIGAQRSALQQRWDGAVVRVPRLSRAVEQLDEPAAPARRVPRGRPTTFVSETWPDLSLPALGVRFEAGRAEVTSPWAVTRLMGMARHGIHPAPASEPRG